MAGDIERDLEAARPQSQTLTTVANSAAASLLSNRFGRIIAATFFAFEIYTVAALPAWQQIFTIRESLGKLAQAEADANAAQEKASGLAIGASAEEVSKSAEANNAVKKATADTDAMEAEAATAYATAINSNELQEAIKKDETAKSQILIGTAASARDQAKATADKMESDVAVAETKAVTEAQAIDAKIGALKNKAQAGVNGITFNIGEPTPASLSFEGQP